MTVSHFGPDLPLLYKLQPIRPVDSQENDREFFRISGITRSAQCTAVASCLITDCQGVANYLTYRQHTRCKQ